MKAFRITETCVLETVVLADIESISYDDPIEIENTFGTLT